MEALIAEQEARLNQSKVIWNNAACNAEILRCFMAHSGEAAERKRRILKEASGTPNSIFVIHESRFVDYKS